MSQKWRTLGTDLLQDTSSKDPLAVEYCHARLMALSAPYAGFTECTWHERVVQVFQRQLRLSDMQMLCCAWCFRNHHTTKDNTASTT